MPRPQGANDLYLGPTKKNMKTDAVIAHLRFHTWVLVLLWTGCMVGSLLWNLHEQAVHSFRMAQSSARLTFENDVLYRLWAARQGGVYVRVSEQTPPNPYLQVPDRDVMTTSGISLTLINPAYMVRLVHEAQTGSTRGHITSLRPMRPENKADAWEAVALQSFEEGRQEVSSVETTSDGEGLRFMRPLVVEKACLKCHAAQGYREGDIRGGISVSVPMAPLRSIERSLAAKMAAGHAILWIVGLAGIGLARRSFGQQILARKQAENTVREMNVALEQRVAEKTVELQRANDMLEQRVAERTGEIRKANEDLNASRLAALNLMDDAILSRRQVEQAAADLARQTEELRAGNEELMRFNRVAVDRELRMIELKKEVNALCAKAGLKPAYKMEEESR